MRARLRRGVIEPNQLQELQGVFDSIWQDIKPPDGAVAENRLAKLRQDLAKAILSVQDLHPEAIRRTALAELRKSKLR